MHSESKDKESVCEVAYEIANIIAETDRSFTEDEFVKDC